MLGLILDSCFRIHSFFVNLLWAHQLGISFNDVQGQRNLAAFKQKQLLRIRGDGQRDIGGIIVTEVGGSWFRRGSNDMRGGGCNDMRGGYDTGGGGYYITDFPLAI